MDSHFCSVTHLYLESPTSQDGKDSLIPFHGFSSTVKSLRLNFTLFEVFDLVCSFPPLKDLALVHPLSKNDADQWIVPSTSPNFTGPLEPKISGNSLYYRSIVRPPGWSPLRRNYSVVPRWRYWVCNGFGIKVARHPIISYQAIL